MCLPYYFYLFGVIKHDTKERPNKNLTLILPDGFILISICVFVMLNKRVNKIVKFISFVCNKVRQTAVDHKNCCRTVFLEPFFFFFLGGGQNLSSDRDALFGNVDAFSGNFL